MSALSPLNCFIDAVISWSKKKEKHSPPTIRQSLAPMPILQIRWKDLSLIQSTITINWFPAEQQPKLLIWCLKERSVGERQQTGSTNSGQTTSTSTCSSLNLARAKSLRTNQVCTHYLREEFWLQYWLSVWTNQSSVWRGLCFTRFGRRKYSTSFAFFNLTSFQQIYKNSDEVKKNLKWTSNDESEASDTKKPKIDE